MAFYGLLPVGTVTDGEFSTLRTQGDTRPLHLWQLIHDARKSVSKMGKANLKKMLHDYDNPASDLLVYRLEASDEDPPDLSDTNSEPFDSSFYIDPQRTPMERPTKKRTAQESSRELGEDKRCTGEAKSEIPRYVIPARRKGGCPPNADMNNTTSTIEERLEKLMREDPVFRRGRLRWLRRQRHISVGSRTRQVIASVVACTADEEPRLHRLRFRSREDSAIIAAGRAFLPVKNRPKLRQSFHKFAVGLPVNENLQQHIQRVITSRTNA
uniref:Uncharacterized protein n=1 Tax=Branchiostoma floridae TaxID=7739 RepID=C3Y883_BRAFL|eukprot:XP_002607542.1 hypothetical protein BRAFLDRAFT_106490 [Branchiostoma floridae]